MFASRMACTPQPRAHRRLSQQLSNESTSSLASPPAEKRRRLMSDDMTGCVLSLKAGIAKDVMAARNLEDDRITPVQKLDDLEFFDIDLDAQLVLETDSEEDQESVELKFSPPTPETEVPSRGDDEEDTEDSESDSCMSSGEEDEQPFESPALWHDWLDTPSAPSSRTQQLLQTCAQARMLVKGENNLDLLEDLEAYARAQYLASYFVHVDTARPEEARELRSDMALEALATSAAAASIEASLGGKTSGTWQVPEESPIDFVESLTKKLLATLQEQKVSVPSDALLEIHSAALRLCADAAMSREVSLHSQARSVAATAVAVAACPWMMETNVEVSSEQIYDILAYEAMTMSDLRRCTQDIADVNVAWKHTRGLAAQSMASFF